VTIKAANVELNGTIKHDLKIIDIEDLADTMWG
jgi:hypothetical protein